MYLFNIPIFPFKPALYNGKISSSSITDDTKCSVLFAQSDVKDPINITRAARVGYSETNIVKSFIFRILNITFYFTAFEYTFGGTNSKSEHQPHQNYAESLNAKTQCSSVQEGTRQQLINVFLEQLKENLMLYQGKNDKIISSPHQTTDRCGEQN